MIVLVFIIGANKIQESLEVLSLLLLKGPVAPLLASLSTSEALDALLPLRPATVVPRSLGIARGMRA